MRIVENRVKFDCYCFDEIGDVEKNSLEEIWNGQAAQKYRKMIIEGCYERCSELCLNGLVPQIHNF